MWDNSWKTNTCDNNPKASYTTEMNKHAVCGFCIFVKYIYNKFQNEIFYWGKDCLAKHYDILNDISLKLINIEHKKCYH